MTGDDEVALLEQIRASPRDNALRAVYADGLLARGDERGEYMHLALEAGERNYLTDETKRRRFYELQNRESTWARELGLGDGMTFWKRGLPSAYLTNVDAIIRDADAIRRLPVVRLVFSASRDLAKVAAVPALAFIEELEICGDSRDRTNLPIPRDELAALSASTNLQRLHTLRLEDRALDATGAAALQSAGWWTQLETLALQGIDGDCLANVLARPLPRLRELEVESSWIRERGGHAIAEAALPVLEHLKLWSAGLREVGADILLGSQVLASVRRLVAHGDFLRTASVILGSSPHVRELRELVVAKSLIYDDGAAALANSPHLAKLESLDLCHNQLTREGVVALANGTGLPALTKLRLDGNPMPSGKTYHQEYYDQGAVVSDAYLDVPISRDEIGALFAHRPQLALDWS